MEYMIKDDSIKSIADAIRNKNESSSKMTIDQMVDEIHRMALVPSTKQTAFAIYSADDESLNFYKRDNVPKKGTIFNGKSVTDVYVDIENTMYNDTDVLPPWDPIKPSVRSIVAIDELHPISMNSWCAGTEQVRTIDLGKINLIHTVDLSFAFYIDQNNRYRLNISNWDIPDYCKMDNVFPRLVPAGQNNLTCIRLGPGSAKIANHLPFGQQSFGSEIINVKGGRRETFQEIAAGDGGEYVLVNERYEDYRKYQWSSSYWNDV